MPEICQNVQKVDYQGAEGNRTYFKFLYNVGQLVLINANVGF